MFHPLSFGSLPLLVPLESCPHVDIPRPFFPLPCLFEGKTSKESPSPLDLDNEWKSTCFGNSSLDLGIFSFPLFFFRIAIVLMNPHLFQFHPCLVRWGKESFLGPKFFSTQPHPSPSSFFFFYREGLLWPPPPFPWNFEPLPHVVLQWKPLAHSSPFGLLPHEGARHLALIALLKPGIT